MNLLQAILLGFVQGVTEWFPISSSGHLAIIQSLFGMNVPMAFDIFLHFASLIVIIFVFYKDIKEIIIGLIKKDKKYINLFLCLIIASIPAGILGFLFSDLIENIFSEILFIGIFLIITSAILYSTKFVKNKNKELNFKNSFVIGLFQAFAILPGISRSGSTISAGLLQGIDPKESARFSFLLSIPVILGASILGLKDFNQINNIAYLLIGSLVTIITGIFTLKFLLRIIDKNKFNNFSVYCFILGMIIVISYIFVK